MRAVILCQIPYSDASSSITTNNLSLVWMDDHIVDRATMVVTSLNMTTSSLPDFHCSIFRAGHHPLPFAVECNTGDVASMSFKSQKWVRVGSLDVVQLNSMVPGSS